MSKAIDFQSYRLRRESARLARLVSTLATAPICWSIGPRMRSFLSQHRLAVIDLDHVLATCTRVFPGEDSSRFVVYGSTTDEVSIAMLIRMHLDGERRHLELVDGRLFTDEEDLVG